MKTYHRLYELHGGVTRKTEYIYRKSNGLIGVRRNGNLSGDRDEAIREFTEMMGIIEECRESRHPDHKFGPIISRFLKYRADYHFVLFKLGAGGGKPVAVSTLNQEVIEI